MAAAEVDVEDLTNRVLAKIFGLDENGLPGLSDVADFGPTVVALPSGPSPVAADIFPYVRYADETPQGINFAQLILAMRLGLFGWPDIASDCRVILDQMATPANNPGNAGTGYTRCYPFRVWRPITIKELGARVGTGGGNSRFCIYQHNASIRRPGALLCATASVATSAGGTVTGPLFDSAGATLANVTLMPALYWGGLRVDNATVQFAGMGANTIFSAMIGDPAIDLLGSSNVGNRALDYAYTGAGFTENFAANLSAVAPTTSAFNNANAHLIGKVA